MSYLYIIAADAAGPVKLGLSATPERRLKQLQTGHPQVLRLFHKEMVSDDLVYFLEHNLHNDLRHLRLKGEWFTLTVDAALLHIQYTLIHYEPSALVADFVVTQR
jgi:superfamily II DNA or RNA helicase